MDTPQRVKLPTPFPAGGVNAWLFPGDEPAIVDTGTNTPDAWSKLSRAVDVASLRTVVVTHAHIDHFGQAARLAENADVEVFAHAADVPSIRRFSEDAPVREAAYRDGLRRAGVPAGMLPRLWGEGRRFDAWAQSMADVKPLASTIELGGHRYDVIHAPGHTAGSVLLHSPDAGHTLTGDTVLETISPNALSVDPEDRNALPTYLSTLAWLAGEHLGQVLPGHGSPFRFGATIVERALAHARRRQGRIMGVLGDGPASAYDIATLLFRKLPDDQLFLAVSEVLGHLAVLEDAGCVNLAEGAGPTMYTAAQVSP